MIWLSLSVCVLIIIYYSLKLRYQYWKKRGILGPTPTILIGNLGPCLRMKLSPGQLYTQIYKDYPNLQLVGLYRSITPTLLIRDPEIIKEITTKSFSHFRDNDIEVDKNVDRLFGRNVFVLKGEEWKTMRAHITPVFTSGKMKAIYPLLEEIGKNLVTFIKNQDDCLNGNGYAAKELCVRFTLNNVASCAFGLEGKCFEEDNSFFRQLAREFFEPGSWATIVMFLTAIFPSISKYLKLKFTKTAVENKLLNMVTKTIRYREENNITRNDFLQSMMQLRKTITDYNFSDLDVTAQAAGFFGDGYETSSIVMSFVLYHLAANLEVQSILRKEILKACEENNGVVPYEVLQTLPYLDETLRIIPPVFNLQKICTKEFTFKLNNSKSVTITENTPIVLPIEALHNDPAYFEKPHLFRPERFVGTNKDTITKCTFMPFGEGPRACLGLRFGLLQIKVGIAYIIKNFEVTVNKKTKLPIKIDPCGILTTPIGGFWLDYKHI